jgi:hypothetical protein
LAPNAVPGGAPVDNPLSTALQLTAARRWQGPGRFGTFGSLQQFTIKNQTSSPLVLTGLTNGARQISGPTGPIPVGGSVVVQLVNRGFGRTDSGQAMFARADNSTLGSFTINMSVLAISGTRTLSCSVGTCTPSDGFEIIDLKDPVGTVITIPGNDVSKTDPILAMCNNGRATCSFTATNRTQGYGPKVPYGGALINPTSVLQSTTVTTSVTQSSSTTVTASGKFAGSLFKLVNSELLVSYGQTWGTSSTFQQAYTLNVPPQMIGQLYAQAPVYIITGNFTVTMNNGNTTYIINGAQLMTPDDSGRKSQVTASIIPCDARCNTSPLGGPPAPHWDYSNGGTDHCGLPSVLLTLLTAWPPPEWMTSNASPLSAQPTTV